MNLFRYPNRSIPDRLAWKALRTFQRGALLIGSASLTACSLLQGFTPSQVQQVATSVALTVAAQAPLAPQPTTAEPPASPTTEPSATLLPTSTPGPTETPLPTNTLEPTYTLAPTFTPFLTPTQIQFLTPTSALAPGCCTLRVRNQNRKATYWIGTKLPYSGNFIEPLHYIEFYRTRYTWITFYWCRRAFHNGWSESARDDWFLHWKNRDKYICYKREVYLDKNLEEIGIQ